MLIQKKYFHNETGKKIKLEEGRKQTNFETTEIIQIENDILLSHNVRVERKNRREIL